MKKFKVTFKSVACLFGDEEFVMTVKAKTAEEAIDKVTYKGNAKRTIINCKER